MSAASYADYIVEVTERFCGEVSRSIAHRESIDRFYLELAQFDMVLSIYVYSDGELSLTASVLEEEDHASKMLALIGAGYQVGDPVELTRQQKGATDWRAQVSGHGLDFKLIFSTKD